MTAHDASTDLMQMINGEPNSAPLGSVDLDQSDPLVREL